MMVDVVMPKMGESITEGTIIEWKKSIGDKINKDEVLLEISTDKVDSDIPSPSSGTVVEIIAQVNETIPVGEVIARISDSGKININKETKKNNNDVSDQPSDDIEEKSIKEEIVYRPKPRDYSNKRFYSPLVKNIAKIENISIKELDLINGTGKDGRVNKSDIIKFIKNKNLNPEVKLDKELSNQTNVKMSDDIQPMSRMRKKIADHMLQSVQISPHVYSTSEVDVTNLVEIRKSFKDKFLNDTGVPLTYTPMIIDATIKAIRDYPLMNASLDNDKIINHRNINMGIAVALKDNNLIVPVISSADEKNFLGLARSSYDLANRSRNNSLNPEEVFGSTFTVTNPGVFGGLFGMGIINQPNVAILTIGAIKKRPIVKETEFGDSIVVRHMMYITLGYDHRLIDGAYGTKFISRIVEVLEGYNKDRIVI
tara:strand:- start:458 stop:1735 length:1278 start_codon:yes stop_codon:yes gene_type:complete